MVSADEKQLVKATFVSHVMKEFSKYAGLDVHKDTIAVSIADAGRSKARYYGTIKHTNAAVSAALK